MADQSSELPEPIAIIVKHQARIFFEYANLRRADIEPAVALHGAFQRLDVLSSGERDVLGRYSNGDYPGYGLEHWRQAWSELLEMAEQHYLDVAGPVPSDSQVYLPEPVAILAHYTQIIFREYGMARSVAGLEPGPALLHAVKYVESSLGPAERPAVVRYLAGKDPNFGEDHARKYLDGLLIYSEECYLATKDL